MDDDEITNWLTDSALVDGRDMTERSVWESYRRGDRYADVGEILRRLAMERAGKVELLTNTFRRAFEADAVGSAFSRLARHVTEGIKDRNVDATLRKLPDWTYSTEFMQCPHCGVGHHPGHICRPRDNPHDPQGEP